MEYRSIIHSTTFDGKVPVIIERKLSHNGFKLIELKQRVGAAQTVQSDKTFKQSRIDRDISMPTGKLQIQLTKMRSSKQNIISLSVNVIELTIERSLIFLFTCV